MEYLKRLMKVKNMTSSDLSQLSGVGESTVRDILNDKSRVDRCSAGTLCCIADVLNTTVEQILDHYLDELEGVPDNQTETLRDDTSFASFYRLYAGTLCAVLEHGVGYVVQRAAEDNWIRRFYDKKIYRQALLLLGLSDYYRRLHGKALDPAYDDLRRMILDHPVYSLNTMRYYDDQQALEKAKRYARRWAIPELARHNIYMTEEEFRRAA